MARKNYGVTGGINIDSSSIASSIIQETITSNSANTVDSISLSTFMSAIYDITLLQGSKTRTSRFVMQTNGTTVTTSESGIVETGGSISGVTIAGSASSGNAILQITVTDAETTVVRYKIIRSLITNVLYVPDAPTITGLNAINGGVEVSFTAPVDNGGSAITQYTITSNPGFKTGAGSSSPITVTGLSASTSYTFTATATNSFGTSLPSSASNSINPLAPTLSLEYLVVAGGGGGGSAGAGGGGAGGFRTGNTTASADTNYNITIGAGGASVSSWSSDQGPSKGSNSNFGSISATGGGGSGLFNYASWINGQNGGSGGGRSGWSDPNPSIGGIGNEGNYSPPEGYDGGQAGGPYGHPGGGGGAGQAGGVNGNGDGGDGRQSAITGVNTYYAGGGQSSGWYPNNERYYTDGVGGLGGGGDAAVAGTANTGGGGGGGWYGAQSGKSGGSGVVILAYLKTAWESAPVIAPTLSYTLDTTTRPTHNVYKFTGGTGNIRWNS